MVLDSGLEDTVEGEIYVNIQPEVLDIIRSVEKSSGFFETETIVEDIACSLFAFSGPASSDNLVRSGKWEDARPVLNIGIPLFTGAHLQDVQACKEILSKWHLGKERMEVFSISDSDDTYPHGKRYPLNQPHYYLTEAPPIDILIVPGGLEEHASANLIRFIALCSVNVICALAFSSGDVSLTGANNATASGMEVDPRGIRTGIEGSFGLLAELYGGKAAQQHAVALGYEWYPTGSLGKEVSCWSIYRVYGQMGNTIPWG